MISFDFDCSSSKFLHFPPFLSFSSPLCSPCALFPSLRRPSRALPLHRMSLNLSSNSFVTAERLLEDWPTRTGDVVVLGVDPTIPESPRPGPASPRRYRLQLLSAKMSRGLSLSLMMKKKMGGGNEHVSKMAREKHMEKQKDVKGKGKVDLLFCCGQGSHKRSASVGYYLPSVSYLVHGD